MLGPEFTNDDQAECGDYVYCSCNGLNAPLTTFSFAGSATSNCDLTAQPTTNQCPEGPVSGTQTAATKPIDSSCPKVSVPNPNPPLTVPSLSGCTTGDKQTVTYSTALARATGYDNLNPASSGKTFWNQPGAVITVTVITEELFISDVGYDLGALSNITLLSIFSSALTVGPSKQAFTLTVPTQPGCLVTQPAVTWSVNPAANTAVCNDYSVKIEADYPCASNTILNPPQCTDDPRYLLNSQTWIQEGVDTLMYDWWYNYNDPMCDHDQLGAGLLGSNVQPPNTLNPFVSRFPCGLTLKLYL